MGCTFSGFNLLYDAVNGGGDVWINERRFKIIRQLGEGGFAYVYLVKEQSGLSPGKRPKDTSHFSEDGIYALKKGPQEGTWNQEAYLLFPAYLNGTLLDNAQSMKPKNEYYPPGIVLHIFKQLCAGLKHMHSFDPPYAHNDVKPGNVLIKWRKSQPPLAVLMDFGSAAPAKKEVRSRSEALKVQEWAAEHCSAPYRAPELWDCPSNSDIDERTDIWSLGCTLYAIMYGVSPFEYALGDSGGSLQLAAMSGQVKWPPGPNPSYPDSLRQFVTWMLQPQAAIRPHIDDVIIHVDKLLAKFPS